MPGREPRFPEQCLVNVTYADRRRALSDAPSATPTKRQAVGDEARTSAKVIRWSLALQRFNFGISFIPGEKNVVADTLSRAPAGAPRGLHAIRFTDFFETGPPGSDEWCQWGAGSGNGSPSAKLLEQEQSRNALALCPMKLRQIGMS